MNVLYLRYVEQPTYDVLRASLLRIHPCPINKAFLDSFATLRLFINLNRVFFARVFPPFLVYQRSIDEFPQFLWRLRAGSPRYRESTTSVLRHKDLFDRHDRAITVIRRAALLFYYYFLFLRGGGGLAPPSYNINGGRERFIKEK